MGSLEGEHGKDPPAALTNANHEVDISGREEGEIVDDSDLEDVSDISAEDEILLRIKILEEYNKALENKVVKKDGRTSDIVETQAHRTERLLPRLADLSEISVSDIDDNIKVKKDPVKKAVRHTTRHKNVHKKSKRKKTQIINKKNRYPHRAAPKRNTESRQNIYTSHSNKQERDRCRPRKNQKHKSIESSEESDYDHKEKRRKLQEAVRITSKKYDMSSLKQRLLKMIAPNKEDETSDKNSTDGKFDSLDTNLLCEETEQNKENKQIIELNEDTVYLITDDESSSGDTKKNINTAIKTKDILKETDEQATNENKGLLSDDDLESLRQLVLKTKNKKVDQGDINETEAVILNSQPLGKDLDEKDNDIEQLRMACLKSAIVRKAEGRKKRKERGSFVIRREKRSHRDSIMDYLFSEDEGHLNQDCTDVESVDMEIGVSDSPDVECEILGDGEHGDKYDDDKLNELNAINNTLFMDQQSYYSYNNTGRIDITSKTRIPDLKKPVRIDGQLNAHDDLDDDEDLLRASLLTSLSERLPRLTVHHFKQQDKKENMVTVPPVQSLVVNLAETDSESDAEATKNLKKLHQSLSNDFQKNLDIFLKNARMQAENKKSLMEQREPNSKVPAQKFTPKALKHLPKSHQLEYKRLLKRMAELEKVKMVRQAGMSEVNTITAPIKVTVSQADEARTVVSEPKLNDLPNKPHQVVGAKHNVLEVTELDRRIISTHNIKNASLSLAEKYTPGLLEKQIELSRRKIAEEAATVMQLKAESKLLAQRVKLAAAELRNVRSALSLNKKKLHSAQITLTKTRTQHNSLISRTLSTNKYNKLNSLNATDNTRKIVHNIKSNPTYIMDKPVKLSTVNKMAVLQSVQISVKNDISNKTAVLSQREVCPIQKENVEACRVVFTENYVTSNTVKDSCQETDRITCNTSENLGEVSQQDKHEIKMSVLEPNLYSELGKAAESKHRVVLETDSGAPSGHLSVNKDLRSKDEDYQSPLQYIKHSWCDDPNAVLCPFEVDGWCKDADCKYLHTKRS